LAVTENILYYWQIATLRHLCVLSKITSLTISYQSFVSVNKRNELSKMSTDTPFCYCIILKNKFTDSLIKARTIIYTLHRIMSTTHWRQYKDQLL